MGVAEGAPEARVYGILAEAISFPTEELALAVGSGMLTRTLELACCSLKWSPGHLPLSEAGSEPPTAEDLGCAYISLFDSPGKVPTPLYTGVYAPRRRDAMEELVRTYRHFGVTVKADLREPPDSVPTVLEFLALLAAGIQDGTGESRAARERALAGVLDRHLCPWAKETRERLAKKDAIPFYAQLVATIDVLGSARLQDLGAKAPAVANAQERPSR